MPKSDPFPARGQVLLRKIDLKRNGKPDAEALRKLLGHRGKTGGAAHQILRHFSEGERRDRGKLQRARKSADEEQADHERIGRGETEPSASDQIKSGDRGRRGREHIDAPVLSSHFCDFEDLLLNDGCTGVAIIATEAPLEIQFDEHKLLYVYGRDLTPFESVFRAAGIPQERDLRLITEGEHVHSSDVRHSAAFQQLCYRLGVGEAAQRVSW